MTLEDVKDVKENISEEQLFYLLSKLTSAGLHVEQLPCMSVYHIESPISTKNSMPDFLGFIQKDSEKENYHANLTCTDDLELKPYHDIIRRIFDSI